MKYVIAISVLLFAMACGNKPRPVAQHENVYYTCSMHPQVMQNEPGKCPVCGMELITVSRSGGPDAGTIRLSDQQIQLGNILTDTIGKSIIGEKTVLTATLNMDESKTVTVNARIAGRIEKLYVKSTGSYVHKGDLLYDLYSEELNNAKQEYLLALEKQKLLDNTIVDFKQLVESSRNKLLLWGMTGNQIAELTKTKNHSPLTGFYSPADGYVVMLESHEGDFVSEGATILRLANLTTVWAEAQVYASQLSQIDRRAEVIVQIPGGPGEIRGRINFVNPEINPETRINLIRVSIPNPGGFLKPGMMAYMILKNRQNNSLTLPADAIIRNSQGSLVWVLSGHQTYKSVVVKTGLEDGDRVEIISGLVPGDIVVVRGAYLLNSEYIIKHGTEPRAVDL